jgi:hypothetical protein
MAHTRKDTLTKTRQWWKHPKDFKKIQNTSERRAAKREINAHTAEIEEEIDEINDLIMSGDW